MEQVNPFIVDGPVPPDSPLYIERDADREVLHHLLASGLVHLIGPSGLGKTSLIRRCAHDLDDKDVRCVIVNISEIVDSADTEESWYDEFIKLICVRLE